MRSILLAAGLGTRLRPITDMVPKCLIDIRGSPLLGYWLDLLRPNETWRVLVNTHHLPGSVAAFVRSSVWSDGVDIVHEPALLGTAGTVLANRRWIEKGGRGSFMVAHADNYSNVNPVGLIHAHAARPRGCLMTMLTFNATHAEQCGIVETDARSVVVGFQEKPRHPLGVRANGAVYIFEPLMLDIIAGIADARASDEPFDISLHVLPLMVDLIFAVSHSGTHIDIGTPESLALARQAPPIEINGRHTRPDAKSAMARFTSARG